MICFCEGRLHALLKGLRACLYVYVYITAVFRNLKSNFRNSQENSDDSGNVNRAWKIRGRTSKYELNRVLLIAGRNDINGGLMKTVQNLWIR